MSGGSNSVRGVMVSEVWDLPTYEQIVSGGGQGVVGSEKCGNSVRGEKITKPNGNERKKCRNRQPWFTGSKIVPCYSAGSVERLLLWRRGTW